MRNFFNKFHIFLTIAYVILIILSFVYFFSSDLDYFIIFNTFISVIFFGILLFELLSSQRSKRIKQLETKIRETNLINRRKLNNEDIALNYLPVGIVIYDDVFNVDFANNAAKDYFSNVLVDRPLNVLNKTLYDNVEKRIGKFSIKQYDKKYDIIHYPKNKTVYLFEVTEREEIKKKYHENQNVIGIISLDNFVEATANMDYQNKSNIEGSILGIINHWCQDNDIYFITLRVDKAVMMTSRKKLDEFMEEGFSILERVSEKAEDNDIRVSLSMGIASFDTNIAELGEAAEDALQLAIDRGGDQVVVNLKNQPTKFFGGKTNTVEKRSKITAKVNSRALGDYFDAAKEVFIMPHKTTDIDALGAAIGLLEMALAKKKKAKIIINFDDIDQTCQKVLNMLEHEYIKLLEYVIEPEEALPKVKNDTLLILVDHHSPNQSNTPEMVEKTKNVIVIDHHRRIEDTIPDLLLNYVEPYASSSVELVTELIDFFKEDVSIHKFEATIMLAGMMIDTNNFSNRTGSRTFEAAASLRQKGADPSQARLILRESLDDIKTKSNLVNKARIIHERFAITALDEVDMTDRVQLAKTADELLEIDNIIAAFAVGKIDGSTIGISARSINDFNVSVIMEKFGGGGHLNNAAAQLKNINTEDIVEKIEKLIESTYKEESTMKVILIKDVKGKGKKGDVIEVATGYGNYLLTSKNAIKANSANIEALEDERQELKEKENKAKKKALDLKEKIEKSPIKLYVKLGESGKLFGSINTKQIADELKKQHSITVDKRKINLEDKINTLGNFDIDVKLHKDIVATIDVQVLEKE
ncbi:MAG: 50S ribosomal protein L9 [Tenericutes bacterium]|jgi:ribosomal protein L9|nr:50S ribosomal protein L9 [Mycoplasmatota bacterium]